MSYQDADLDLTRTGYIMINGHNECIEDNARSNGAGKSSIFSALSWCLTGQTISGAKEVSNLFLDGITSVTLELDIDDIPYEITRTKNPSNLTIIINNENISGKGIRDSEKILAERLPDLTFPLLTAVVVLGQGLPQRFTNNTPSGRKEVLETLSKSDFMIEDIKKRLADRKKYLDEVLLENRDERTALTTIKEVTERQMEELLPYFEDNFIGKTKETLSAFEHSYNKEEETLNNNYDTLERLREELREAEQKVDEKQARGIEELAKFSTDTLSGIHLEVAQLKADKQNLEREIKALESDTGICPTCGQLLPNHEKIDTTEHKQRLAQIDAELLEKTRVAQAEQEEKACLRADYTERFNLEISNLKQVKADIQEEYDEVSEITNKLYNDHIQLKASMEKCEQKLEACKTAFSKYNQLKEEADNVDKKLIAVEESITNINSRIDINSKMSTLVKRDFRGYLLINVIDYINAQAKEYSKGLFGTDRIEFKLDGNNISISYDSKEYELLSGGEKQKVDLIIQLAIRDMLRVFLDFSSNILVLDEITDAIDNEGTQQVFSLLSEKLTDVQAVYMISHHVDFQLPVDYEINVVKGTDKISRIM